MSAYIYRITNHITSQCYIGKTTNTIEKRFARHISNALRGDETYLYRSMRKYGVENFSVDIVEETNAQELNEREIFYIQEISPELNMTVGGEGGSTTHNRIWINDGVTNKYILKADDIPEGYVKGRICKFNDPEFQKSMAKRASLKMTKEDFMKRGEAISKSKKGKTHIGVPHSQETKRKLSEISINRKKIKCEHCNILVISAMYARWHGDKCKYAENNN